MQIAAIYIRGVCAYAKYLFFWPEQGSAVPYVLLLVLKRFQLGVYHIENKYSVKS